MKPDMSMHTLGVHSLGSEARPSHQVDGHIAHVAILDDALGDLAVSSRTTTTPTPSHSSFKMTTADTQLPILTHARLSALIQHFISAAAYTTVFGLARANQALDDAADHHTLTLEHRLASLGTGVLGASAALDFVAAAALFLDRSKSAKQIKETQWMPSLANLSNRLKPFVDHIRTIQNGISNVALFGAISSAGALWATRESLRQTASPASQCDDTLSTAPPAPEAPSTGTHLQYAQLATTVASYAVRAIVPPVVSTCVNLDEAKQRRHRYDVTEALGTTTDNAPVELMQIRALPESSPTPSVPRLQTFA